MAYSDKVIDHYSNPKNVGTLDKASKSVGTGLVGAPECGDVMRLQIEVDQATGLITDAKFLSVCFLLTFTFKKIYHNNSSSISNNPSNNKFVNMNS